MVYGIDFTQAEREHPAPEDEERVEQFFTPAEPEEFCCVCGQPRDSFCVGPAHEYERAVRR